MEPKIKRRKKKKDREQSERKRTGGETFLVQTLIRFVIATYTAAVTVKPRYKIQIAGQKREQKKREKKERERKNEDSELQIARIEFKAGYKESLRRGGREKKRESVAERRRKIGVECSLVSRRTRELRKDRGGGGSRPREREEQQKRKGRRKKRGRRKEKGSEKRSQKEGAFAVG